MWRLGFFFHEMGFGLLSIFLPLHIIAIGGSLVDIGIMSAAALFVTIPTSFFWGYICDKTRRYKRYILLSFLSSAIILYAFTFPIDLTLLVILYAIMSAIHVAHEAPKNVLVAEMYSRPDWERSFAFYEGFTEIGWLIGLLLGFLASTYGLSASNTLLVIVGLNLAAFATSLVLVTDPPMIFERGLVSIERTVGFACHGVSLASRIIDGISVNERLKRENVAAFCGGLILFSLATSILFTPMPIFVSNVTQAAALPASVVFAIFVVNSGGGVLGYLIAGRRSDQAEQKTSIGRTVILRTILTFLLIAVVQTVAYGAVLAAAILTLMGFIYAFFTVHTLSLSMELIPSGKAGLFNALAGIGAASGSLLGPVLAQSFGFIDVFVLSGVIFAVSYVAFKIFA